MLRAMLFALIVGAIVFLVGQASMARIFGFSPWRLLDLAPRSAEGTPGQRVAARLAGPMLIYLAAAVFYTAFDLATERLSSLVRAAPGMPAAVAGVQDGDRVVAVDGEPISRFDELRDRIAARSGTDVELTIERSGVRQRLRVEPDEDGRVGVVVAGEKLRVPVVDAIGAGLAAPFRTLAALAVVLGGMLFGEDPTETVGGLAALYTATEAQPAVVLLILSQNLSVAWPMFLVFSLVLSAVAERHLSRQLATGDGPPVV